MSVERDVRGGDPDKLVVLRFSIAAGVGALIGIIGWIGGPKSLSGHFDVVGYPLYADFDVNRYFDAFYLIAIVFPIITFVTYLFLARFGPLRRRSVKRRAPVGEWPPAPDELEVSTPIGAWGRVGVVGAIVGLAIGCGESGNPIPVVVLTALGWTGAIAFGTAVVQRKSPERSGHFRPIANALGAIALIPLAARIAGRAGVVITSNGKTVHYALFPIQVAFVLTAIAIAVLGLTIRHRVNAADVDRAFLRYLAVPFAIFAGYSFIPGALGPIDTFGEGEYLAAGTRIVNGALPWRDIWLIHGLLDDGLKSLVGFAIFGFSRWGATAGITALLTPAYFVGFYLFCAYFLRRSWALVAAGAIAFSCSVFVDWDIRYLLLPLVVIALVATLRRPNLTRGAILGFALVAQSVLVPELTLAVPPLVLVVLVADAYGRRGSAWTLDRFRGSMGVAGGLIATGGVFGVYLLATHSLRGFVDYYRNFGDAHSLTGGIPLYTNYALYGHTDRLGVVHFFTTPTGITTRYAIELVLPLVAILAVVWIVTATVRGGRRLTPDDFVAIGLAGLVLLYFQKSISRGDLAHIGEVFAVSTPLLVVVVARLAGSVDRYLNDRIAAWKSTKPSAERPRTVIDALRGAASGRRLASLGVFLVVAIQAPVSVWTIVEGAPGRFLTTVGSPAPKPFVKGGPSLGFAGPDALPPGMVTNLNRIFTAEAGRDGSVFDLSDVPGIVDFLLERNPASRFYDVSLAITPLAQRLVVADIAKNNPKVILFSGISGLSSWDYIANDVRQYIVADYVLNHYTPLVYTSGELVLVSDAITPVPLPRLVGHPTLTQLYFSQSVCQFGYIPDFLDAPSIPATAVDVPLLQIPRAGKGRLYRLSLPADRHGFQWLALSRTGSGPVSVTIGNIVRASGADVPWHDITWVAQSDAPTVLSVGSCLQWHGYGPTLYLRYVGPGDPTSVRLFNAS